MTHSRCRTASITMAPPGATASSGQGTEDVMVERAVAVWPGSPTGRQARAYSDDSRRSWCACVGDRASVGRHATGLLEAGTSTLNLLTVIMCWMTHTPAQQSMSRQRRLPSIDVRSRKCQLLYIGVYQFYEYE